MSLKVRSQFSQWEIIKSNGLPICEHDGIFSVSVAQNSQILTEPIEGGELAAYNKVQAPDGVSITLILDTDTDTQAIALRDLLALKKATGSNSLCRLITPYEIVENLALESISKTRSATENATLLLVELQFVQVLIVNTATRGATWAPKKASSANSTNRGKVQKSTAAKILL